MALTLHLKYAEKLKGRAERLAKVTFRGLSHYTKVLENVEDSVVFDEMFEWPVARPIEAEEVIDIQIYNYNKYLSNRLVGTFRMILQELIEVGCVKISDCLLDNNNVVMKTTVTFELSYNAPDGSVGLWQKGGFEKLKSRELRRGLNEEERLNELNKREDAFVGDQDRDSDSVTLSPSLSIKGSMLSLTSKSSNSKSPKSPGSKTLGSVVKMAMMKRSRQTISDTEEDRITLTDQQDPDSSDLDAKAAEVASMLARTNRNMDQDDTTAMELPVPLAAQGKRGRSSLMSDDAMMKAQDFQVCITILEARQLAGLNMDPVVCVQVGDQRKFTSVKESTNCPYYNEYFVFDFHMPPLMLFDKIITLSVQHFRKFLRSGSVVGCFKLDIATVYRENDHQFYHKWAMLTDPDDINGGVKGYLKCDIAVIGKGDSVKVPPKSEKEDDDIEANLLLPDGVPADRQKARYIIKIYKAEGLPKMNTGLMANVKKAFTGENRDLTDPFVEVHFAGHKGRTSVRKGCYEPVWNEQVIFTEMFPPLCRRIRLQLRDSDSVQDDVIGTHFLDLSTISHEGEKGFLPTFGPAWINLYGSTRDYQILAKHGHLNDGLGEGVSYRGRVLVALKTEIIEAEDIGTTLVEVEPALPISDTAAGRLEEYFLLGVILEATMIDRKTGDKPIHFEISIGNAGNVMDGYNAPCRHSRDSSSDDSEAASGREDDNMTSSLDTPQWVSTTQPVKPVTIDKCYYHLPYYQNKPCVYVRDMFEDHRRRLYNSNIIDKICEKLDDGLTAVNLMIEEEQPFPEQKLRMVFEELGQGCSKFVSLVKGTGGGSAAGKTKLDKERHKLLVREMDQMSTLARTMKATVTKSNMKDKLKAGTQYLNKLKSLAIEPQHALPDVLIWMVSNNKRIAYQRLPARQIIYSIVDEERGRDCGKPITLLLKLPGKKAMGSAGWTIQTKLQVFLWLGLSKHKKDYLKGLPKGYEETKQLRSSSKPCGVPPNCIHYTERQSFQLRAHMYQARQLIGSDASGLSDPFARIAFAEQSMTTQVIEQTLSPTWDEMLILKEVQMYGTMDDIVDEPPTIVVEIFDQDKVGKSEFIGRALCRPVVKLSTELYGPPKFPPRLEWWDIYRGPDRAGELLAAFELLQLAPFGDASGQDLPPLELPATERDRGPIMPVPKGIRPILSKHRIEVLFWGVRDLKRVQLQSVDHPRIDVECAGHVLSSSVVLNCKKNPNFSVPVKYFDVELPENELYCPPITIRCVDCRSFGRFTLVGTHVISNLHKFMYVPTTTQAKNTLQKIFPLKGLDSVKIIQSGSPVSRRSEDVAINVDENLPLISKDQCITIDTLQTNKEKKTTENKKTKSKVEDDELDLETLDWWSKYFASVETLIREGADKSEEHGHSNDVFNVELLEAESKVADLGNNKDDAFKKSANGSYGTLGGGLPNDTEGEEVEIKQAKRFDKDVKRREEKEKRQSRPQQREGTLAKQLSPKAQRKLDKLLSNTSQLKRSDFMRRFQFNKQSKDDNSEENIGVISLIRVYPTELESQTQFEGFRDWLHTFELYRGKNMGNDEPDENRVVGKFKGSMKIYKIPLPPDIEDCTITGGDPAYGLFQGLPSNEPVKVLVRVYIVKANDLHPADINGKADPYLVIRLGSKSQNDKDNYISKQLNPVFGKCFEFEATFPMESLLTVQVYDWDLIGVDDLIGETKLDLENRYYSRHRASCGLAQKYELHGYNAWRDPQKPTQILARLCKDSKVDGPYYQPGKVRVSNRIFTAPMELEDENGMKKATDEHLALAALNNWHEIPKVGCHLVPEHVETRPLFHPEKPGIEQGKLEMFVDMFPMDMPAPGPPVDISPRKPKSYELRCIIWNTDDVVLEDDAFFTGEKMSDIYVKGWIKGSEDMQSTDIHYRSLTGEGNFNWRFVFPFDYLVAEEKIVISRKETLFSWDETESKIPARLNMQVWDADHFSADDFLGALTLDLNRFPRGAKSSKLCTLDMLKTDGSVPQMSLFKHKRVKGWWPFHVKNEGSEELELTGKVEAELHLMSAEEAEKHPAGLGRSEPDPLEKPNRPDSSFMWFMNPFKSLRYILWHNYKWMIIKLLLVALLVALLILFFYSMPGYTVKKMFNA
ncbi:otoferlin-like isoform X5 [Biomphalaria glabrata]|uniref:Otoferlin-like isoform X5 n=1 Tax=Biomphalaria glabrata TaxID=6526 RepID=A0A9W3AG03_BIOGL|nr:otoferlin-like isoform X5 [Biomphalaria glabrata]